MRKILYFVIFGIFTLAANAAPKTISEYFKAIPTQVFTEGNPEQLVNMMKRGDRNSLVDTKNGFMRLEGDGAQVSLQIALFRYSDKSPLLAVSWGNLEEADFTHLTFFKEKNGKMVVEDRHIFPIPDSDKYVFELPRYGRTVTVRNAKNVIISKYEWTGEKFIKL